MVALSSEVLLLERIASVKAEPNTDFNSSLV